MKKFFGIVLLLGIAFGIFYIGVQWGRYVQLFDTSNLSK